MDEATWAQQLAEIARANGQDVPAGARVTATLDGKDVVTITVG